MDEGFLLRASVVCSIVGVVALYIISGSIDAGETDISRITMGEAEGDVVVRGSVSRIFRNEDVMIIGLQKNEEISVVMFSRDYPDYMGLSEGDEVEVRGSVDEYEGEKEIIAEEMRIV
ncbi:MAG: OB-fold nucleic acid binding domain-containing protein [Candidatus Woesearchaeota archaeon]